MYINDLMLIPRISRKPVFSHHEDMQTQRGGGPGGAQQIRVHIRWMIRRDMPEVLRIEQTSHDYPWCEEDFLRCLRQRNCIGKVAEQGEKIVGFMIYELHKTKYHFLNFAVHPDFRRHGVGTQMIEKKVSTLSSGHKNKILIEIRETNLDAQLFFRSCGFRATGVSRESYSDTGEDAYIMEYRLREPMENNQAAGNIRSAS